MFKKLLVALMIAVFATVGCSSVQPVAEPVQKPEYIYVIEDAINHESVAVVDIVRWENDGFTLWLWIDSDVLPLDCDFVMVLGIVDQAMMKYNVLGVWTDKNQLDPCGHADKQFLEYTKVMDEESARIKEEEAKKGGI